MEISALCAAKIGAGNVIIKIIMTFPINIQDTQIPHIRGKWSWIKTERVQEPEEKKKPVRWRVDRLLLFCGQLSVVRR